MSLINDALRKARQAAAEHEDQRPGAAFQAPRAYPSKAGRRGPGIATVVVIAVVAAVSGAALVWWALDRGDRPETATVERSEIPPEKSARDPASTPATEPTVQLPMAEVAPTAAPERNEDPRTSSTPLVPEQPEDQPSPTEVPEVIVERPKPTNPGDRIFVLDADLGDIKLSLGYIVARGTNPFAEINGTEVFVGSEIAGFVVESIEAEQVTLKDSNGPLVLKVR